MDGLTVTLPQVSGSRSRTRPESKGISIRPLFISDGAIFEGECVFGAMELRPGSPAR